MTAVLRVMLKFITAAPQLLILLLAALSALAKRTDNQVDDSFVWFVAFGLHTLGLLSEEQVEPFRPKNLPVATDSVMRIVEEWLNGLEPGNDKPFGVQ